MSIVFIYFFVQNCLKFLLFDYPLEYYTAYFTIRAKGFDYEMMCFGKDRVDKHLKRIAQEKDEGKKMTATEKDIETALRSVQEMYARGFEFMPIDVYRAHSRNFQIIDGKIMPSFMSIAGVADTAAEGIVEAAKKGEFTSRDDFRERTKVSGTIIETMTRLGILADIPESNQFSVFDFMG